MDRDLTGIGILFDKDGTLFDFAASWAAASARILHLLADGDAARLNAMAKAAGFDLDTQAFLPGSIIIAGTGAEVATVLAQSGDLPLGHVREVSAHVVNQTHMVPVAGLDATLAGLRGAGAQLGVVTNDGEASARIHLEANGILDAFHAVVGYDSGFGPKPEPGPCLGGADLIGVAPERCLMVGDSTHDLEAGRAAGMICVGVLTGIAKAAVLAPHAAVVLPTIAALPAWLNTTDVL